MNVRIEFFGIARRRAGTAKVELPVDSPLPLGTVLKTLRDRFPALGAECIDGTRLRPGYVTNLDGQFVEDPTTIVDDGATLLILSTDSGG